MFGAFMNTKSPEQSICLLEKAVGQDFSITESAGDEAAGG